MNDTISRQAAIDALRMDISIIPFAKAREYVRATIEEIYNRLEELPSAQTEPCEDAVSRRGAVDHFRSIIEATDTKEKYNEGFVDGLEFCISHLSTMPPAQPEPYREEGGADGQR